MAINDRRTLLECALILAVVVAVHHAIYSIPFLYSEIAGIKRNVVVTDPSAFVERMLTPKGLLQRPLSVLSYTVNHAVHGERVAGYHAVNLAIHGVNALLVYRLAVSLATPTSGVFTTAPLVAGLVFGLHPLATACVSQIFGRNYSLATMFFLTALLAYLRWRPRLGAGRIAVLTVLCLAAVLSKQTFAVAPLVFAWSEIAASGVALRPALDRLGASWWAVVAAGAATLVGVWLLLNYAIPLSETATIPPVTFALSQLGNALVVAGFYVLPYQTALIHDLYLYRDLAHVEVWIGVASLAALLVLAYRWRTHSVGWLLGAFALMLLPTNSVVPKNDLVREWRLYPALPFYALLVGLAYARVAAGSGWRRIVAAAVLAVYLAMFAHTDVRQNRAYQSSLAAWQQVLERYPYSADAMNNIGLQLHRRGDYTEALGYFERAATAAPDVSLYRHNMAQAYAALGDRSEAERHAVMARTLRAQYGARSMTLYYR